MFASSKQKKPPDQGRLLSDKFLSLILRYRNAFIKIYILTSI